MYASVFHKLDPSRDDNVKSSVAVLAARSGTLNTMEVASQRSLPSSELVLNASAGAAGRISVLGFICLNAPILAVQER